MKLNQQNYYKYKAISAVEVELMGMLMPVVLEVNVEVDENHEVDKLVEVEEEVDKELKLNNNVGKKVGGSSDTRK